MLRSIVMSRLCRLLRFGLLTGLLLTTFGHRSYADRGLFIGVNQYQDTGIPTLAGCVEDAEGVAGKVSRLEGFRPDIKKNATKGEITAALDSIISTIGRGERFILFY